MIFWWSRGPKRKQIRTAQFSCPSCREMQSCAHFLWVNVSSFCGFSGSEEYIGEVIECGSCHQDFRADDFSYNATTLTFDPVMWDCPFCKHLNPNNTYVCFVCQRSLI